MLLATSVLKAILVVAPTLREWVSDKLKRMAANYRDSGTDAQQKVPPVLSTEYSLFHKEEYFYEAPSKNVLSAAPDPYYAQCRDSIRYRSFLATSEHTCKVCRESSFDWHEAASTGPLWHESELPWWSGNGRYYSCLCDFLGTDRIDSECVISQLD